MVSRDAREDALERDSFVANVSLTWTRPMKRQCASSTSRRIDDETSLSQRLANDASPTTRRWRARFDDANRSTSDGDDAMDVDVERVVVADDFARS